MKKLTFIVISALFFANSALADDSIEQRQPTLAALEAQQQNEWQLPEHNYRSYTEHEDQLKLDAEKLNAKIDSELDARLNEKLNQQLKVKF